MPTTRTTRNIRCGTVLVAVSTIWASGETLSMLRRRGLGGGGGGGNNDDQVMSQPQPQQQRRRRRRRLSTNDEAHKIDKKINICRKKTSDTDCGLWDSIFHSDDFDCSYVTFGEAYDSCKGVSRKDYCGCTDDDDLVEWVDKFLDERRRKNYSRYGNRPYPAPRKDKTSHGGFLELALCIKDDDPHNGLLCRQCEWWSLKHMAEVCFTSPTATDDYCGCNENALLEYYDRLVSQGIPIESIVRQSGETLRSSAEPKTSTTVKRPADTDTLSSGGTTVRRPETTDAPAAGATVNTRPTKTDAPAAGATVKTRPIDTASIDDGNGRGSTSKKEEEETEEDESGQGFQNSTQGERDFGIDDDETPVAAAPTPPPTMPSIQDIASGILSNFGIDFSANGGNNNNNVPPDSEDGTTVEADSSMDEEEQLLRADNATRPPGEGGDDDGGGAIGGEGSRKHIGGLQLSLGPGGNINFVASFRNGNGAKNVQRGGGGPKLDAKLIEVERREGDSLYYDWSFHDDDDRI